MTMRPSRRATCQRCNARCCGPLTSPRALRGEVGLRSNPGEGHGTREVRSMVHRTGTTAGAD
ncbi:hypothetical protein BRAO285_2870005 [Bradyrhizobium sp. ORS 285]|nr:hypothetical protein BRAO285_2870005 [Bradyrhizobium sp. ORS 285]